MTPSIGNSKLNELLLNARSKLTRLTLSTSWREGSYLRTAEGVELNQDLAFLRGELNLDSLLQSC